MRNFFQKILILFTGNNYPEATQNEFYQWLVDEDHASQKEDALRELWNKAQRQKNVKGMQKSYARLKNQEGIPTVPNRLDTAIYSDSRNEKFDAARRNKSATQLEKYTFISAGVYRR